MIAIEIKVSGIGSSLYKTIALGLKKDEEKGHIIGDYCYLGTNSEGVINHIETVKNKVSDVAIYIGGQYCTIKMRGEKHIPVLSKTIKEMEEDPMLNIEIEVDIKLIAKKEDGTTLIYDKNTLKELKTEDIKEIEQFKVTVYERSKGKTNKVISLYYGNVKGSPYKKIIAKGYDESTSWRFDKE